MRPAAVLRGGRATPARHNIADLLAYRTDQEY